MALTTAFLLYDGVAELDFAAPWQVFTASQYLGKTADKCFTISLAGNPVTCIGGMKVVPDYRADNAPKPDILIVPGTGDPAEQMRNQPLLDWIAETSKSCLWTVGVCTGTNILAASGVAAGKKVTTHWDSIEALKKRSDVSVLEGVRYVRDGNLLTSAGVSAGLDMSLWLIGQIYDAAHARQIQHLLEYYPAPPYAAEV